MLSKENIKTYCTPISCIFHDVAEKNIKYIDSFYDLKDKKIFVESKHKIFKEFYPNLEFVSTSKKADLIGYNDNNDLFDTISCYIHKTENKIIKYKNSYKYDVVTKKAYSLDVYIKSYIETLGYNTTLSTIFILKEKYYKLYKEKCFFKIFLLRNYYEDSNKLTYDKDTQDNICGLIKNAQYDIAYTLLKDMKYNVNDDFIFKLHFIFNSNYITNSNMKKIQNKINQLTNSWNRK
jgi:hypothetical protein